MMHGITHGVSPIGRTSSPALAILDDGSSKNKLPTARVRAEMARN